MVGAAAADDIIDDAGRSSVELRARGRASRKAIMVRNPGQLCAEQEMEVGESSLYSVAQLKDV